MTDPEIAAADQRLLATLRERVERRHEGLTGPSGEGVDELEVEGLAVLMAEWTAKADSPDPAVQAERRAIRARIDAFRTALETSHTPLLSGGEGQGRGADGVGDR